MPARVRRTVPGRSAQMVAGIYGPARATATFCPAGPDSRIRATGQADVADTFCPASKIGGAGNIGTADTACAVIQARSDNVAICEMGGHHGKTASPPATRDIPFHVPGPDRLAGISMVGAAAVHSGPDVPGRGSGPGEPLRDPGRASRPGPGEGYRGQRRRQDADDLCATSPGGQRTYRSEFRYGSVTRLVRLPAKVDAKDVTARYERGVLEVSVPAREVMPENSRVAIEEVD